MVNSVFAVNQRMNVLFPTRESYQWTIKCVLQFKPIKPLQFQNNDDNCIQIQWMWRKWHDDIVNDNADKIGNYQSNTKYNDFRVNSIKKHNINNIYYIFLFFGMYYLSASKKKHNYIMHITNIWCWQMKEIQLSLQNVFVRWYQYHDYLNNYY